MISQENIQSSNTVQTTWVMFRSVYVRTYTYTCNDRKGKETVSLKEKRKVCILGGGGLKGGKRKEKCNYITTSKVRRAKRGKLKEMHEIILHSMRKHWQAALSK